MMRDDYREHAGADLGAGTRATVNTPANQTISPTRKKAIKAYVVLKNALPFMLYPLCVGYAWNLAKNSPREKTGMLLALTSCFIVHANGLSPRDEGIGETMDYFTPNGKCGPWKVDQNSNMDLTTYIKRFCLKPGYRDYLVPIYRSGIFPNTPPTNLAITELYKYDVTIPLSFAVSIATSFIALLTNLRFIPSIGRHPKLYGLTCLLCCIAPFAYASAVATAIFMHKGISIKNPNAAFPDEATCYQLRYKHDNTRTKELLYNMLGAMVGGHLGSESQSIDRHLGKNATGVPKLLAKNASPTVIRELWNKTITAAHLKDNFHVPSWILNIPAQQLPVEYVLNAQSTNFRWTAIIFLLLAPALITLVTKSIIRYKKDETPLCCLPLWDERDDDDTSATTYVEPGVVYQPPQLTTDGQRTSSRVQTSLFQPQPAPEQHDDQSPQPADIHTQTRYIDGKIRHESSFSSLP